MPSREHVPPNLAGDEPSTVANDTAGRDPAAPAGTPEARQQALAGALAIIGDRWSLVIVQQLLKEPRRFSALRRGIAGLSANILTQRLKRLAEAGVAVRRSHSSGVDVLVYDLTDRGRALGPIIGTLEAWMADGSTRAGAEETDRL